MAKTLALFITLVSIVAYIDGAVAPSGVCHDSYDCVKGSCCRDGSGHVLSRQEGGFMHFPHATGSGTCSTPKAQMGEMCDSNCQCDVGMECYRPMSGVCCPPMTCHNATWVQHQKHYWANCMKDPHCAIPP